MLFNILSDFQQNSCPRITKKNMCGFGCGRNDLNPVLTGDFATSACSAQLLSPFLAEKWKSDGALGAHKLWGGSLGEKLKKILLKIVSACLCRELYHKTYFLSGILSQSSLKTFDGNKKWKLCRREVGEYFWALSFY
jgi:hypothetical protein